LGFPSIISATAEASDFKFGVQLEFAKAHDKNIPKKKWAWPWVRGTPKNVVIPFSISSTAEA